MKFVMGQKRKKNNSFKKKKRYYIEKEEADKVQFRFKNSAIKFLPNGEKFVNAELDVEESGKEYMKINKG